MLLKPRPAWAQNNSVFCPPGVVGWWPGDGNITNLSVSGNANLRSGATFAPGYVSQAFNFDGVDDFVEVEHHPVLNPQGELTVQAWINRRGRIGSWDPILKKTSGANGYALEFNGDYVMFWVHSSYWYSSPMAWVPLNTFSHVAGVFDGSHLRLYVNGIQVGSQVAVPGAITPGPGSLNIGRDPSNPERLFRGQIDEIAIFNRALTTAEIAAIYAAGTNGMRKDVLPPTILTQPVDLYPAYGSDLNLTATVSGTAPLAYQWLLNGTNLPGATNSALNFHSLTPTNNGRYSVLVSNDCGVVSGQLALLLVDPPNLTGRASAPTIWRYGYDAALARAELLYAEARIEKSEPGTYFCAIGGNSYYMGLMDGGSTRHVHFSVWDPTDGFVWKAPDVEAGRFGGEGTGWVTHWFTDWQTNIVYPLCVRFVHEGSTTIYAAYFFDPLSNSWKHTASIARSVPQAMTDYFYSFNEDFASTCWLSRSFFVGNEWVRTTNGTWVDLDTAYLSVAYNQCHTNAFDADVQDCWVRLEAGGDTICDTPPGSILVRKSSSQPPTLPTWDTDEDGLPDAWEQLHFGSPIRADATADADGDGLNNLQECRAGTDPKNAASALRIVTATRNAEDLQLTWTCVAGKSYVLQTNASPSPAGFANCSPAILASGNGESTTNYSHWIGAGARALFYRVRLVTPYD